MNTFHLQLLKFPEHDGPGGIRLGARAYIALKTYSTVRRHTREGDCEFIAISPECVTPEEIRFWADAIIQELETIRDQASRPFEARKESHR